MPDDKETAILDLVLELQEIKRRYGADNQAAHQMADTALLRFIRDPRVRRAFDAIEKWYA